MIPYAELEAFFTGLVKTAQSRGIVCAITSGMACVHFGVAATTKDCDVLCAPEQADDFRSLIAETALRGLSPNYRGNISPPLDARWMRGGWTAHFTWKTKPEETCLDIFGIAPRGSSPWQRQMVGSYARQNVVAEMKRTNREKDWPFATALGGQMLENKELDGWLHLYDVEVLRRRASRERPDERLMELRPVLRLAPFTDELMVKRVLLAERVFWSELDLVRIGIYQRHLRPYLSAVRRARKDRREADLAGSHAIRIECALAHLPFQPLRAFGFDRMVAEARKNVGATMGADIVSWLPVAERHFDGL